MKKFYLLLSLICFASIVHAQSKIIKGKLSYEGTPLVNAEIKIKNSENIVSSDLDGAYDITAEVGDVIQYSYPSLETTEIMVEDVTTFLNVDLKREAIELDEVVVKKKLAKSQLELGIEYFENKDLIKTVFGIIDGKRSNFTLRVLQAEDLNRGTFYIQDAVQGLIPGLSVRSGLVFLRRSRSPAVYEVNGMLFENIDWLTIDEIYRIGVILPGIGTQKYGLRASGGVIVINTKGFANNLARTTNKKIWERNSYFESLYTNDDVKRNWPCYLKELHTSRSLEEAIEIYSSEKNKNELNPYFFIDAHHYFLTEFNAETMANRALEDGHILESGNSEWLKAVAYSKDAKGSVSEANELYKAIFKLRPSYSQSYRDLANSYRRNGEYAKSATIYSRFNHIVDLGMLAADSSKLKKMAVREIHNLLELDFNSLDKSVETIKNERNKEDPATGTRLVFEWNTSNAEFELEFRGKEENLSHVWKHTFEDNPEMMRTEQLSGYSSVDYFFDSKIESSLSVNINYLGNKKLAPTYMKVTVYRNYGTPNQTSDSKVHRLQLKNVPQGLLALDDI